MVEPHWLPPLMLVWAFQLNMPRTKRLDSRIWLNASNARTYQLALQDSSQQNIPFTQIGTDALSQVLKEFWPDVKKKMSRKRG